MIGYDDTSNATVIAGETCKRRQNMRKQNEPSVGGSVNWIKRKARKDADHFVWRLHMWTCNVNALDLQHSAYQVATYIATMVFCRRSLGIFLSTVNNINANFSSERLIYALKRMRSKKYIRNYTWQQVHTLIIGQALLAQRTRALFFISAEIGKDSFKRWLRI